MNLTPEQKDVGKQNFLEAVGSTRRDFLKGSILGGTAAGATLGATYFNYGKVGKDRLRVGIIGTGDEGGVLIGALNPDYIEVVAIADIRPYSLHRAFHGDNYSAGTIKARPGLMNVYDWKTEKEAKEHVAVYNDYEELIADENVEAVLVVLPLWLHDIAAIKAMKAGKHVLTEKLMAHSIAQCKEMARVSEETGMILATGHQRHYSILYDNAVSQIRSGLLGDIHHIRAQWHRGNLPGSDSWQPPLPVEVMSEKEYIALRRKTRKEGGTGAEKTLRAEYKLLEELHAWSKKRDRSTGSEADLWAKRVAQKQKQLEDIALSETAADYGYVEKTLEDGAGRKRTALEELIRWRLWDRTGGGLMAELGSHQLDAASIFISAQRKDHKKVMPLSVTGVGGRHLFPADRDVDDHVYTMFEFPAEGYFDDEGNVADSNKKIVVSYSSINGNGFGGYGEIVLGTKGTLILERETDVMLFKRSEVDTKISVSAGKDGAVMNTYETGGGQAAVAAAAMPKEPSRGYREEIEHWAYCIKNPAPENLPKCPPKVAMADAIVALTSNIAMKENRRIQFKPEWFDVASDETPEGIKPRPISELG